MSSKTNAILFLIWMTHLVECQSLCQYIVSNGTYTGIGIYRFYDEKGGESLWMYNKADKEWRFETVDPNLTIKINESSVSDWPGNAVLHKFGIMREKCDPGVSDACGHDFMNCQMKKTGNNSFKAECKSAEGIGESTIDLKSNLSKGVFVTFGINTALVLERSEQKQIISLNFFNKTGEENICDKECWNDTNSLPKFLKQIDDYLYHRIDGVIYFLEPEGFLILFNIEGHPKYCFTFKNQKDISEECKSSSNMRTLFDECFDWPKADPLDSSMDPLVWVIIGLLLIANILTIAVVFMVIRRKRQRSLLQRSTTESTSTDDSVIKSLIPREKVPQIKP